MQLKYPLVCSIATMLLISSCSRKHVPQTSTREETTAKEEVVTKPDSIKAKRTMVKRIATPKVIVVNDKAARKSTDGRLYYDLDGHRYWKNYKDGKYYLFNQSMYSNPAFKPHQVRQN